ncbi:MAG: Na+/H+ antiporter subunit E [Candidatus Subteraquimicrobiales bacterium]|nr:Na+/H+ antiporter subunit E [Candidatus Subteraquimicrobiales bacterium]
MGLSRRVLTTTLFLWAFWIVLTSNWQWFNLALGLACSFFVSWGTNILLREQKLGKKEPIQTLFRFIFYLLALIIEIIKANIDVAARVLSPSLPIQPHIVKYRPQLKEDLPRTVLANSITLTPGTLTVDIDDEGVYYIHCLAEIHAEGLFEGALERSVIWVFGGEEAI